MDETPTTPTTASPKTASHMSTAPVSPIAPTGPPAPSEVRQGLSPVDVDLPEIEMPDLDEQILGETRRAYAQAYQSPTEITAFTPLPEPEESPEGSTSSEGTPDYGLGTLFQSPPRSPADTMHPEEWRQTLAETPTRGTTRPVSPSQPYSPNTTGKRLKTSPSSYSYTPTPGTSPLQDALQAPGASTSQLPVNPEILGRDICYMPHRRTSSLPLVAAAPPEPPFDVDAPPESETDTSSVKTTDFIHSMNTWDDPIIAQPEDAALLLYLAGTAPY